MGDLQINGAAVLVIGGLLATLAGAVAYMFKAMRADHAQRMLELRADFQQTLKDLRADYQTRLDECRSHNVDLMTYLNRQAGTVKESTEILRALSGGRTAGET